MPGIDLYAVAGTLGKFGIGFPAWSGGVRQFVKGYPGGRDEFLQRADYLAEEYGSRFEVPASLRD